MSDDNIYFIERILDRRRVNDKYEYKIKWENYPMSQSTWEPLTNLQTAIELVEEYDRAHPFPPNITGRKRNRPSMKKCVKEKMENKPQPIVEKKEENENPKEEEKTEKINLVEEQPINIEPLDDHKRKYNIDESLETVTTVRKRDDKLMAVVKKNLGNGIFENIEMETNKLKIDNPWILLDFYESKIKFT
jgi:hypothetical protein